MDGRCERMLALAEEYRLLQRLGTWEELRCATPLGFRPPFHPRAEVGTPCEPWLQRGAVHVLSRLLERSMHGLEWSAGSSTRWYLLRLGSLHSVEHEPTWANMVERQIRNELPDSLTRSWTFDRIPYDNISKWHDYVSVRLQRQKFSFISVDGRSRSKCLERVLTESLLEPGGLLLLDNSMRKQYSRVKARVDALGWPSVEFDSTRGRDRKGHRPVPDVATKIWCRSLHTSTKQVLTVVRRATNSSAI